MHSYYPELLDFIKDKYKNDSSGHDWQHILRVKNLAVFIAEKENKSPLKAELLALLHEFTDHKLVKNPEKGLQKAENILLDLKINEKDKKELISDIPAISFRGAYSETLRLSENGKIVQDGDRLDAMGAIGIARTFAYGGKLGRKIYEPEIFPVKHSTFKTYKNSKGPTINHFYETSMIK